MGNIAYCRVYYYNGPHCSIRFASNIKKFKRYQCKAFIYHCFQRFSFAINRNLLYISYRLLYNIYITVANYRSSYPLTRLITTNAPNGTQPRAVPRFQICSTVVYGVANRSIERREGKKRRRIGTRMGGREGPREGDRRGQIVPFGSASTSVNAAGLPRTPRRTH